MKKILSTAIIFLFLASTAQAKVTYKNTVMNEMHLYTVKGLLYDLTHSEEANKKENKEKTKIAIPQFAIAVVWLTDCFKSPNVFKLEKLQNVEARVIKDVIETINDVLNGKYKDFPIENAMSRWTALGSRVVAIYEKGNKNWEWKLKLKPEEFKTKFLIYKHEPEVLYNSI